MCCILTHFISMSHNKLKSMDICMLEISFPVSTVSTGKLSKEGMGIPIHSTTKHT